jgi:peptidyl-dipeptidase Dcp
MIRRFTQACAAACLSLGPIFSAQAADAMSATPPPQDASYDFSRPSSLPFELPPFDKLTNADYLAGIRAGMAEQREKVAQIVRDPAPASFENTIVALERSAQSLIRVTEWFNEQVSSNTNDELDAIQTTVAPELAAHQDAIYMDPVLYARVQAVYAARDTLGLDSESMRLLERYRTQFLRAGAALSDADKVQLKSINKELAQLLTTYQQDLLKNRNAAAILLDRVEDLAGAAPQTVAAAAQAAKAAGHEGKWLIALENTTRQPILAELRDRGLRERIYQASIQRGFGGPNDATVLVSRIAKLRARQAKLLGYANFAAYVLDDAAAKTPANVNRALHDLAMPALANARKTAAKLQALIDREAREKHTASFRLQPWDWELYAEQLRRSEFDFDESQVKPYFEIERVLQDGVFYAAHELYGISFRERPELPVYRKGVRCFEVLDADGSSIGLILLDFYARPNKQGGAWMTNYIDQSELYQRRPVVVNNLNVAEPPPGQPTLLSFSEVTTMFHEFGHGLHGLFSRVRYPLLSGTAVAIDFVEYPSQLNEMWASDPKVFAHYARHYGTGAPMPAALSEKLKAVNLFNESFDTTEYLSASMLDQAWHQITEDQAPEPGDVARFEAAALKKAGMDFAPVPPRYRSTYFSHIFNGGYGAAYYAYIWSAVLAADTKSWMRSHGGLDRANGDFLRAKVLSRGNTIENTRMFELFYGAGPDVAPLLEERGLAPAVQHESHGLVAPTPRG